MIKKTPTKKTTEAEEVKVKKVTAKKAVTKTKVAKAEKPVAEVKKVAAVAAVADVADVADVAPKKATKVTKHTKKETKTEKPAATVTVSETGEEILPGLEGAPAPEIEVAKAAKVIKVRGYKYQAVRSKLDKSKILEPAVAIELVKKMSYSKFTGSLEVHVQTKEIGTSVNITLPHSTGKTVRVAIASEEVIAAVEAGKIDFDVLVSTPQFMGKLARLAKVLGPKGLMPNPKNGTLTDNPERKAKELAGGAMTLKTEKKAPLMHLSLGKLSMDSKDLTENLNALLKALRGKADKMWICATMSPSVKVIVEQDKIA